MITYRLICDEEHEFDGWFRDSAAYEKQAKRKLIECPDCGSRNVTKAIMAPAVATRKGEPPRKRGSAQKSSEPSPAELMAKMDALARKLRGHVEKNFDYVGDQFATEARKIHDGEADERGIYGEAKPEEVKELVEDGIPVAPLPDGPEKAN